MNRPPWDLLCGDPALHGCYSIGHGLWGGSLAPGPIDETIDYEASEGARQDPLDKIQNQCLRQVLWAFRATPIRQRETEAEVPPLDLWIRTKVASFQRRLEASGLAEKLRLAPNKTRESYQVQRQGLQHDNVGRLEEPCVHQRQLGGVRKSQQPHALLVSHSGHGTQVDGGHEGLRGGGGTQPRSVVASEMTFCTVDAWNSLASGLKLLRKVCHSSMICGTVGCSLARATYVGRLKMSISAEGIAPWVVP